MKVIKFITGLIVLILFYLALFYQDGFINSMHLDYYMQDVVFKITFIEIIIPTAIVAVICGYVLGNIGLMMQDTFHNGIVGPELLGISAIISCINAIDLTFHLKLSIIMKLLINICMAFIIGIIVFILILKMRNMVEVILMGTISAMLINGIIIWMMSIGGINNATVILNYLLGTVSDRRIPHMWIAIFTFCLFILIYPFMVKYLTLTKLSDDLAQGIGVDIYRLKIILLFIAIVLTACVVTIIGPISFVSVLAPHIARMVSHHKGWQTFFAGSIGSILLLISLNLTHISSAFSIPTGVITSLIGIPLFIIILVFQYSKVKL